MKALILLLTLVLSFLGGNVASATSYPVLYVSANGSPVWPCGTSPAQACQNIGIAVSNANVYATTTIKVAKGNYTEYISITDNLPNPHTGPLSIEGGWNADFTAQTNDPSLTRITSPDGNAVFYINAGIWETIDLRLAYLTLHGTSDLQRRGLDASAYNGGTINLAIEHCRFESYRGEAMGLYGENYAVLTFTLTDSTLRGTVQKPASSPWPGGGVYAYLVGGSTGDFTITGNRIVHNEAVYGGGLYFGSDGATLTATLENNILAQNRAMQVGRGAFGAATVSDGTMTLYLTNNTITSNDDPVSGTGLSLYTYDTSTLTVYLKNTIVWEAGSDIKTFLSGFSTLTVTADFSIVGDVDTSQGGTYNDNGSNINTSPILNADYHLTSASPARNKGVCGIKIPPLYIYSRIAPYDDIDGDARPGFNTILGCDIGADEYKFPWFLYNSGIRKK